MSIIKKIGYVLLPIALFMLMLPGLAALAEDNGRLNPEATTITTKDDLSFTCDVSGLSQSWSMEIEISPAASNFSISENIGTIIPTGKFTATNGDAGDRTLLHFTITPDTAIITATEYTVTLTIADETAGTTTEEFSFMVTPGDSGNSETPDDGGTSGDNTSGSVSMGGTATISGGTGQSDDSTTYKGSADNYLKSLSVSGYRFTQSFNKTNDTYLITVSDDVTELKVSAKACDSSADVAITGNEDLQVGLNKILISVTADNGEVRYYRIYVTRSAGAGRS